MSSHTEETKVGSKRGRRGLRKRAIKMEIK
jgi:hypothetical protein